MKTESAVIRIPLDPAWVVERLRRLRDTTTVSVSFGGSRLPVVAMESIPDTSFLVMEDSGKFHLFKTDEG